MRRLIISRLIWIYAVCKSLLLSPLAVKEYKHMFGPHSGPLLHQLNITVEHTSTNYDEKKAKAQFRSEVRAQENRKQGHDWSFHRHS